MDLFAGFDGISPVQLFGVLAAGVIAGFINTLAGGGSLLTLPALIMLGLPPDVANGTNRIGVVAQTFVTSTAFRRAGKLEETALRDTLPPTLLGALAGAGVAAFGVPREHLGPVLLAFLVAMAVLLTFRPNLLMTGPEETPLRIRERPRAYLWLFLAGLYGGFVQAGVGFLLLATFGAALRYDFVRANALKVTIVFTFNLVALGIFVYAGQVRILPGLLLAAGTSSGGFLATRFALKVPPKVLRGFLLVAVIGAAAGALRKLTLGG